MDSRPGVVLSMACEVGSPWGCHLLANTMCELTAACGDGGGREVPRGYVRTCELCEAGGQSFDPGLQFDGGKKC